MARGLRSGTGGIAGAILAGALAATFAFDAGPARAEGPDYSGTTGAVFLPYLNAPLNGMAVTRPPKLGLSFGDGPLRRATLDTGSTGIVVSAAAIPNVDQLPTTGPGTLTYSSSGRIMKGSWVLTPVTLSGVGGASVATRPLPVLAVREVACLKTARNCRPRLNPKGIAMVGVGFARQGDHQAQSTPDHNPFLSVAGMGQPGAPGKIRRGYVVTRSGVWVGLDAADTAGFSFVKLERNPTYPDWSAAPACISVAGKTPPACGTALVDTGVTTMYLRVPPEQLAGQGRPGTLRLPPGTSIALSLAPGADGPGYSFKTGEAANPLAPLRVTLVRRAERPEMFVNTSVRLLNGFDYLYDADGGYVGYRPLKPN